MGRLNPATDLTDAQEQAARMIALGASARAAAKALGKHEKTISRWLKQSAFQQHIALWRAKGEKKTEARQDKQADVQAEIARAEQAAYAKALEKLSAVLDTEDPKILLGAIREARECFLGSKDGKPDVQIASLLAAINAGGGMRRPLDEPLVTHEVMRREAIH